MIFLSDLETRVPEILKSDSWLVIGTIYYQISKYVANLHYLGHCGTVLRIQKETNSTGTRVQ